MTKEFLEYCEGNKIIPFGLPPHTSHILQPLDVSAFQPFKHWHKQAVELAVRSGCLDFNKVEFLYHVEEIRKQTFKPGTIRRGWEQTGLWPFNPEVVLQKLRPRTPEVDNDDAEEARIQTPRTPYTPKSTL